MDRLRVGVVRRKSYTREVKLKVVQFFEGSNGRNLYQICKRFSLNKRCNGETMDRDEGEPPREP